MPSQRRNASWIIWGEKPQPQQECQLLERTVVAVDMCAERQNQEATSWHKLGEGASYMKR